MSQFKRLRTEEVVGWTGPVFPPRVNQVFERAPAVIPKSSRSWIGSTLVILPAVSFLVAFSKPENPAYRQFLESVFDNWVAMGVCATALSVARRKAIGPLPAILRVVSGVLLPIFVILTVLELLVWPTLWDVLSSFGVIEKDVRPAAFTAIATISLIGCVLLMLRAVFRWARSFSRRYEHSGLAVGFGPVYFFFRRRRISH